MQVEIPPGLTEQQVFFELLSSQGSNWVARLRELARNAVDRMAWAAFAEILPELWAQQGDTNLLIQEKKALERALSRSGKGFVEGAEKKPIAFKRTGNRPCELVVADNGSLAPHQADAHALIWRLSQSRKPRDSLLLHHGLGETKPLEAHRISMASSKPW